MADTALLQSIVKLTRPLFIILSLALCGCIQMHTTVHVRKDGSGTIEEKMLFSEMLSGIMKEKGEGLPALPKKTSSGRCLLNLALMSRLSTSRRSKTVVAAVSLSRMPSMT